MRANVCFRPIADISLMSAYDLFRALSHAAATDTARLYRTRLAEPKTSRPLPAKTQTGSSETNQHHHPCSWFGYAGRIAELLIVKRQGNVRLAEEGKVLPA